MPFDVMAQVAGGSKQIVYGVGTIGEVKKSLNLPDYAAAKNGESASDNDSLSEGDFITLTKAVKGGVTLRKHFKVA